VESLKGTFRKASRKVSLGRNEGNNCVRVISVSLGKWVGESTVILFETKVSKEGGHIFGFKLGDFWTKNV